MPSLRAVPPIQFPPDKELAGLHGQWVAIVRGVVVGAGKTARAAHKAGAQNGHHDALIAHIPLFPRDIPGFYQLAVA